MVFLNSRVKALPTKRPEDTTLDTPTLTFHDHVAYAQALRMLDFLYSDAMAGATIQEAPLGDFARFDGENPTHQWEVSIMWEYDEEPTWYILNARADVGYTTWTLYQDTYPDMLMSVKLCARR